jgi:hypothetical protein
VTTIQNKSLFTEFRLSDFLAGLGSVLDLTGAGADFPIQEFEFQPTALFIGKHEDPPAPSRGFQADRKALMKDWQKVGNDLHEAVNEYRKSVGV